jgi:hypothetical protein
VFRRPGRGPHRLGFGLSSPPVGGNEDKSGAAVNGPQQAVDKPAQVEGDGVVGVAYAYELRRGDQVLSTGRLTMDDELGPGDEVTVAGVVTLVTDLT